MSTVDRDDLYGDNIPAWVIEAAGRRHEGWMRKKPGEPPDIGMVWEWVLDNCGLPAAYRRALDVIAHLGSEGSWTFGGIAMRVGVEESTLRKTWVPNLEEWGWLRLERPPHGAHQGVRFTVTVPLEQPPDRVSKPARSPGKKPGVTGQEARGDRARSPEITGQEARQGNKEVAKVASRARTRAVAASQALGAHGFAPTSEEDARFWSVVGMVEAREGRGLPRMPNRLRHDVARLIARVIPDDNSDWQTGGDRALLVVADLVDRGPSRDSIINLAATSLGVGDDEARAIIHGRRAPPGVELAATVVEEQREAR